MRMVGTSPPSIRPSVLLVWSYGLQHVYLIASDQNRREVDSRNQQNVWRLAWWTG
jgi:hypothetical protein